MHIPATLAEQIAIDGLTAERARIDARLNAVADEARKRIVPPEGKKLADQIPLHFKGDYFEYDEAAFVDK